jgi:hypothetical protein
MRRFPRILLASGTALSAMLVVAMTALWVRTEAMRRTDSVIWGVAGVYHIVEFSGDDAEYKILRDPGFAPTPLQLRTTQRGWLRPPPPSRRGVVPRGTTTWIMPSPSSLAEGKFEWSDALVPGSGTSFPATSFGGPRSLGFEYATFDGWYGPGTSLHSYRFSYFLVIVPAAVLPAIWMIRCASRRWRHGRFGPGRCRACGYDLRATPDRCPECGVVVPAT